MIKFISKTLLMSVCMAWATNISAQEADLKKIHEVLNTVEQNYKSKISVNNGAYTIKISYLQQVDDPNANMFSPDDPNAHFPEILFRNKLDYSNPFPGFPHKPSYSYSMTISKNAVTVKMSDKDIALQGDLDSQGNDKKPADPFKTAWQCTPGTSTFAGVIYLPNRKVVKMNATNTCSHTYAVLRRSMQGRGQMANGKWKTTHGGVDYYPVHNFGHTQTTTYSIPTMETEAGYSADRFIYEMVNGGIYFLATNKTNGNLKLEDEDRLCTIYAFWKAFGMTDEKYTQIYNSLVGSSKQEGASLDDEYQKALALYKEKDYAGAAPIYMKLKGEYEKMAGQSTLATERTTYLQRLEACSFRAVYATLQSASATGEEKGAAIDTALAIIDRHGSRFADIADFAANTADLCAEMENDMVARYYYVKAFNLFGKWEAQTALTQQQEIRRIECIHGMIESEGKLLRDKKLKVEDCKGVPFVTNRDYLEKYVALTNRIQDREKSNFYYLKRFDMEMLLGFYVNEQSMISDAFDSLCGEMGGKVTEARLKQFKSPAIIKTCYPKLYKQVLGNYSE